MADGMLGYAPFNDVPGGQPGFVCPLLVEPETIFLVGGSVDEIGMNSRETIEPARFVNYPGASSSVPAHISVAGANGQGRLAVVPHSPLYRAKGELLSISQPCLPAQHVLQQAPPVEFAAAQTPKTVTRGPCKVQYPVLLMLHRAHSRFEEGKQLYNMALVLALTHPNRMGFLANASRMFQSALDTLGIDTSGVTGVGLTRRDDGFTLSAAWALLFCRSLTSLRMFQYASAAKDAKDAMHVFQLRYQMHEEQMAPRARTDYIARHEIPTSEIERYATVSWVRGYALCNQMNGMSGADRKEAILCLSKAEVLLGDSDTAAWGPAAVSLVGAQLPRRAFESAKDLDYKFRVKPEYI